MRRDGPTQRKTNVSNISVKSIYKKNKSPDKSILSISSLGDRAGQEGKRQTGRKTEILSVQARARAPLFPQG